MPPGINLSDFYYLMPEIVLTTGALLLLLADLMTPRDKQSILAWVTLGVLGATAVALIPVADANLQVSRGLVAVAILSRTTSQRNSFHVSPPLAR